MTAPMGHHYSHKQIVVLTVTAALILLITMGARQTSGLLLLPITQSTGVSVVAFSFALAIGQFMNGAAQPLFGAIADKYGAVKVVIFGAVLMALGAALMEADVQTNGHSRIVGNASQLHLKCRCVRVHPAVLLD